MLSIDNMTHGNEIPDEGKTSPNEQKGTEQDIGRTEGRNARPFCLPFCSFIGLDEHKRPPDGWGDRTGRECCLKSFISMKQNEKPGGFLDGEQTGCQRRGRNTSQLESSVATCSLS